MQRLLDESFPRSKVTGCRQRGLPDCSNPEAVEEGGEQSNASLVTVRWPLQRVRHADWVRDASRAPLNHIGGTCISIPRKKCREKRGIQFSANSFKNPMPRLCEEAGVCSGFFSTLPLQGNYSQQTPYTLIKMTATQEQVTYNCTYGEL